MNLLKRATEYWNCGLCVLPADPKTKRPTISWKEYQEHRPDRYEIDRWFIDADGICIVCGEVSGNVEMIDFDFGAYSLRDWKKKIPEDLYAKLVVEESQSGGAHIVYRCTGEVDGNAKLAHKFLPCDTDDEIKFCGKPIKPVKIKDSYFAVATTIETRGSGGIFLCAPTDGYALRQGAFTMLPVLSHEEREKLLNAARELDETPEQEAPKPEERTEDKFTYVSFYDRAGDDFNTRGDINPILERNGWRLIGSRGDNEYWRRPGKDTGNHSATFNGEYFYVFSSNAYPFEASKAYSKFGVYAVLEHNGDYSGAAAALRDDGYGDEPSSEVDLSEFLSKISTPRSSESDVNLSGMRINRDGLIPKELMRCPGFISELMDYTMAVAPYPNVAMSFCGALAMQAFLCGRKIRTECDTRTNLYLLGLAQSAGGKDAPRKVNVNLAYHIGAENRVGDRFASGEAIQDSLFATPSMMFQNDEIDGLLRSITRSRDAHYESIMGTLLTMYSSAASVFPMRRRAGDPKPGAIDQPNLVLFGTAVPNYYYESLSERMLSNGLFSRMIVVESHPREPGQEPRILPIPNRVLAVAKYWYDYRPSDGNLSDEHPTPTVVRYTSDALRELEKHRGMIDAKWLDAEARGDAVATSVWGRVGEQVRKLSLLYAASECNTSPEIGLNAVSWSIAFMQHVTERMLTLSGLYGSASEHDSECGRIIRILSQADHMTHSVLLKKSRLDARRFRDVLDTLSQRGEIVTSSTGGDRRGPSGRLYRIKK